MKIVYLSVFKLYVIIHEFYDLLKYNKNEKNTRNLTSQKCGEVHWGVFWRLKGGDEQIYKGLLPWKSMDYRKTWLEIEQDGMTSSNI